MPEGDRPEFLPPTAEPPRFGEPAPPAPSTPSTRRNYSTTDPGHPGARRGTPAVAEPGNPLAVWSIVLGTIGLLLLLTFLGVVFVNLPCSVLAWILGAQAQRRPGQASMAQAGKVIGIVGTVLGALAAVFWGAVFVAAD